MLMEGALVRQRTLLPERALVLERVLRGAHVRSRASGLPPKAVAVAVTLMDLVAVAIAKVLGLPAIALSLVMPRRYVGRIHHHSRVCSAWVLSIGVDLLTGLNAVNSGMSMRLRLGWWGRHVLPLRQRLVRLVSVSPGRVWHCCISWRWRFPCCSDPSPAVTSLCHLPAFVIRLCRCPVVDT